MTITKLPGHWVIAFTWEPQKKQFWEFIERLKAAIPASARSYNKDTNEWTISDMWRPEFDRLYEEMFTDKNQISMEF